jgi:hypothetical protein
MLRPVSADRTETLLASAVPLSLIALAGLLLAPTSADALPRYAARYGQSCQTCHVDPSGGGLRNLYASTLVLPMDLVYKPRAMDKLSTFDPRISDQLLVGLDLRTLFLDGEGESGRIVQMQSDVYASLTLDENTRAVVEIGRNGNRQAYGLARVLPSNGTLKAGRFVPEYGWVFADHQRVTRKYLLDRAGSNDPAIWEAAGIEVGLHPDRADISFSLNEGGQIGDSFTARAVGRIDLGPLHVTGGASALRRWRGDGHRRALGAFGAVGVRELTALVQYDDIWESGDRERLFASEIDWLVHQGWTVIAGMDARDPDRRLQSGAERQWFLGLDLLATPHFGATLLGRFNDVDRGAEVTRDRLSMNAVLHFFY